MVDAPATGLLSTLWTIGEVAIVDHVSVDLAEGEFLAVIGPNGAGKTSLFNLISGLRRPTDGTVTLAGPTSPGSRRTAGPAAASAAPSSPPRCSGR